MAEPPTKIDAGGNSPSPTPANAPPNPPSFAHQLFMGQFAEDEMMPYFEQPENAAAAGDSMVAKTKSYCSEFVFPDRIDQHSMLPAGIVKGMSNIGVTGMTCDQEFGGNAMSVFNLCRVLEIIGGHCGSTAAMVRLQSCVILNLLQTYGTPEQQAQWMPGIAAGDQTGALVITEELAGSDIGNVRTAASPKASGKGYKITGEKRWIANGGEADLLIVLARTPDDYLPAGKVSAFLVPATAKGISVETHTPNKLGLKGVSISTVTFKKVAITNEDVLGNIGDGLAMVESVTVLDRIALAATAVGSLKFLLQAMVEQGTGRTQFGKTIGQFDQVKAKIANVAANLYGLEAAVYHAASQYDYDKTRLGLESQMLKLFASQSLWSAINDAMDICGGKSVFKNQPLERMLRDIRYGLIAEGSNDLLKQQIVEHATDAANGKASDTESGKAKWWNAASKMLPKSPTIDIKHEHLRFHSRWLANHIGKLGRNFRSANSPDAGEDFVASRVADLATNLFMSSCVFSKLSALMVNGTIPDPEKRFSFDAGSLFLQQSKAKNLDLLDRLNVNLDDEKATVADHWLSHAFEDANWPIAAAESAEKPEA